MLLWDENGKATDPSFTADACAPCGGCIDDTKVLLHAIRTGGGLGDEMCGGRVGTLDLHETFRTDSLVATTRVVNIRRIVLSRRMVESYHTTENHGYPPRNRWDTRRLPGIRQPLNDGFAAPWLSCLAVCGAYESC